MTSPALARPAASLLIGRTVHRREQPFMRRFDYRIAMIDIDIDRLEDAGAQTALLSIDRLSAFSFHQRDHGARSATTSLRAWAEDQFARAGVRLDGGAIRLASFPRVLGFGFSPISIWFGRGPEGDLRGVIYEVHNTFGEAHAYVSALEAGDRGSADKAFHVSPFFGVEGRYRFTLRSGESDSAASDRLELIVENITSDGRLHVASLMARRRPLSGPSILSAMAAMPLSGLGVVMAIHWQALILWLKGARYRDKPAQRVERTTLISASTGDIPADERPRKRA
jgi:hypothetical protein